MLVVVGKISSSLTLENKMETIDFGMTICCTMTDQDGRRYGVYQCPNQPPYSFIEKEGDMRTFRVDEENVEDVQDFLNKHGAKI